MSEQLNLPGSVSVSMLRVYDWETEDGLHGGSPHFHTVSSEAYVVTGGSGRVQTLTAGGFAETELRPGRVVTFSPGTIHRLLNEGDLQIVTLMQNAGLPESGDAVLVFPLSDLDDPAAYRAAAALPENPAARGDAARVRRDRALLGFAELRAAVDELGPEALRPYYERAAAIVADRLGGWNRIWQNGPQADAERTGEHLEALTRGDVSHLLEASLFASNSAPDEAWGMCGRLTVWPDFTPR